MALTEAAALDETCDIEELGSNIVVIMVDVLITGLMTAESIKLKVELPEIEVEDVPDVVVEEGNTGVDSLEVVSGEREDGLSEKSDEDERDTEDVGIVVMSMFIPVVVFMDMDWQRLR